MFKLTRYLAAPCAAFLVAAGLSACGGGVPSNAVVQVGGMPITKAAFAHWMGVAAASTAGSSATEKSKPPIPEPPDYTACIAHYEAAAKSFKLHTLPSRAGLKSSCAQQYQSILKEVLGFLISSQWVLGEGDHLGVHVSDQEVHKQFTTLKNAEFPQAEKFEQFLAASGQTVSDVLLRVKLNLLSTKIQQKVVKNKGQPTHAQIVKYYNENPSRFGTPEKRDIRVILTKTEAAAMKARQEIESGQSFASVAKRVSIEPTTRSGGGLLAGVVKGQESPALNNAIFASKVNVVGGPIKTPFGYYVYEVVKITAGSQQSLAAAESAIRLQLTSTHEQAALSKFVNEFKKKWMAETDCRAGYVVPDCKQYKAPKTGATGTEHP